MYMLQHTYKCYIRFIITEPEDETIINLRVGVLYIMNIFPSGRAADMRNDYMFQVNSNR